MIFLTLSDLLLIAHRILDSVEFRDVGLLESAIARPKTMIFGKFAYEDIYEQAAALVDSIVNNHALVDGNKRLGLAGLISFLGINGFRITCSQDAAFDFIMEIASSSVRDIKDLAKWIRENSAAY
ncbi:MAG: hypothetical protein RLZZ330_1066 [Actinomycetota bacterium]|jgi:death-on-curing protein